MHWCTQVFLNLNESVYSINPAAATLPISPINAQLTIRGAPMLENLAVATHQSVCFRFAGAALEEAWDMRQLSSATGPMHVPRPE